MKNYEILAIIPARGGSKRLPGKNLKMLAGETLLARTIHQAQQCPSISRLVVSTEDDLIRAEAQRNEAQVIIRPMVLATDGTPTLPVLQHTLTYLERYEDYKPLIVVLLQCTSPLRTVEDIETTINLMLDTGADSSETMCGGKENGAVYVTRRSVIMDDNRLLGDRLLIYEMPEERSIDIDTQDDFFIAERNLAREKMIKDFNMPNPILIPGKNSEKKKRIYRRKKK